MKRFNLQPPVLQLICDRLFLAVFFNTTQKKFLQNSIEFARGITHIPVQNKYCALGCHLLHLDEAKRAVTKMSISNETVIKNWSSEVQCLFLLTCLLAGHTLPASTTAPAALLTFHQVFSSFPSVLLVDLADLIKQRR